MKLKESELLQSPMWGDVQEADGRSVFYVEGVLVIKHPLPFGKSWLYSPRPNITSKEMLEALVQKIEPIAKKENAIFWKIEGGKEFSIFNFQFSKLLLKSNPLQPAETFIIDITQSETELLKSMKPKTRYNIGLAKKKGVSVRWSKDVEDVGIFYKLLTETARRQNIRIHSKEHYRNIIRILGGENAAAFIIAYSPYEGGLPPYFPPLEGGSKGGGNGAYIPIAVNLVTFFGDTATYLHGGADNKYRSFMAPYLLQWESILEAKRRGCEYYDFGGCAVTQGKIKEWAGITRFKKGFGGQLVQFGRTYDIVFQKTWYQLYKLGQDCGRKILNPRRI